MTWNGAKCSHQAAMSVGAGEVDAFEDVVDERAEAAGVDVACCGGLSLRREALGRTRDCTAVCACGVQRMVGSVGRSGARRRIWCWAVAIDWDRGQLRTGWLPRRRAASSWAVFQQLQQVGPWDLPTGLTSVCGSVVTRTCGACVAVREVGDSIRRLQVEAFGDEFHPIALWFLEASRLVESMR